MTCCTAACVIALLYVCAAATTPTPPLLRGLAYNDASPHFQQLILSGGTGSETPKVDEVLEELDDEQEADLLLDAKSPEEEPASVTELAGSAAESKLSVKPMDDASTAGYGLVQTPQLDTRPGQWCQKMLKPPTCPTTETASEITPLLNGPATVKIEHQAETADKWKKDFGTVCARKFHPGVIADTDGCYAYNDPHPPPELLGGLFAQFPHQVNDEISIVIQAEGGKVFFFYNNDSSYYPKNDPTWGAAYASHCDQQLPTAAVQAGFGGRTRGPWYDVMNGGHGKIMEMWSRELTGEIRLDIQNFHADGEAKPQSCFQTFGIVLQGPSSLTVVDAPRSQPLRFDSPSQPRVHRAPSHEMKEPKWYKYCEVQTNKHRLKGKCRAHRRFCKLYQGIGLREEAKKHCDKMLAAHMKLVAEHKKPTQDTHVPTMMELQTNDASKAGEVKPASVGNVHKLPASNKLPVSSVSNLHKDCWSKCDKKQGPCKWCGSGACCRRGRRGSGCDGTIGGQSSHQCVQLKDKNPHGDLNKLLGLANEPIPLVIDNLIMGLLAVLMLAGIGWKYGNWSALQHDKNIDNGRTSSALSGRCLDTQHPVGMSCEGFDGPDLWTLLHQHADSESIALEFADGSPNVTYRELHTDGEATARCLTVNGVAAGHVAAILMHRGKMPLASMLGVIQAGATFVNMEPKYPRERIEMLLEDSGCSAILVEEGLADHIPPGFQGLVICAQPTSNMIVLQPNLLNITRTVVDPADPPVFLQYTSGSSGKPKGVLMGNRALVARLHGMQSDWPAEPGDKWLMKASMTFGVFEFETFLPLAFGITIVVLPVGDEVDPDKINDVMIHQNVSHATFITPQLMQCMNTSEEHSLQQATALKHVVQCGAPLSWACVHKFASSTIPEANLWNAYGASESSLTCWRAPRDMSIVSTLEKNGSPPFGKALPLCQVHLLKVNSTDEIYSEEEAGEICFTGAIASGYKDRPEETAKSFIQNPFREGTMMYRTGDMGLVKNGLLFGKGRVDRQVKVQGKRLELDEVESAVTTTANNKGIKVDEVVAVLVKGEDDNAVHVYLTGQADLPADEIRQEMKLRVPSHIVPALMTTLQELPRLASGKVDVPALTKLAEESVADTAQTSINVGPYGSLSEFLNSDEGRRLQDQGLDSLGMVKLFKQSDDEVKTVDNMYALAMMMIIFYHMAGGYMTKTGSQYIYVPFVTPDSMTVWCIIAGYQEGARAAAKGPDRPVRFHNGDFVLFDVWIFMRFVLPGIMMLLWSVLAPSGMEPIAQLQGWGSAWSTQYGWMNDDSVAPWAPAWFLKWLMLTKVHAVVLSCLRIPAAVQIVLLLALGNLNFLVGQQPLCGEISTYGLVGDLMYSICAGDNLFWNMSEMVDAAWYVAGIYYVKPALFWAMKLGQSWRNAVIATLTMAAVMAAANVLFSPHSFPASDSGWEDGRSVLGRAVDSLGTWGSLMHHTDSCKPNQSISCVAGHYYKYWGLYTGFCLLFWPLVVWLKVIVIQKFPFHMAAIGKTTLGAFMIHIYMPRIPGMGEWHTSLGDYGAALAIVVSCLAYALVIQYTVGRLTQYLTMLAIAPGNELCIYLWDSFWDRASACWPGSEADGKGGHSKNTPVSRDQHDMPAKKEAEKDDATSSTSSDDGKHSSSHDSSDVINSSTTSTTSIHGLEGLEEKPPAYFTKGDEVSDELRPLLTKVCERHGEWLYDTKPTNQALCDPELLTDKLEYSLLDWVKPHQFNGLPSAAASHPWYKCLLPIAVLCASLTTAFTAQVVLPLIGKRTAEYLAILMFAPDLLAASCKTSVQLEHCDSGSYLMFLMFWVCAAWVHVHTLLRLGIYCYRLWLGIQPIKEHVDTGLQHCLLVCEYKEPLEVLQMTLRSIRDQTGHIPSSEIEVVVACEFRDSGRDETFNALKEEFMPKGGPAAFKRLIQTVHKMDNDGVEIAGKSSNENHAVRELYKVKTAEGADPKKVLLTIADADSLFAPEFFAQLDHTWACYPSPEDLIYDGPLNSYGNYFDLEFYIQAYESKRCTEQTTTVWEMPIEELLSNYSLSLHLAEKVGFWDPTNTPEDIHTSLKAYIYTNASVTIVPVFSVICNDAVSGFKDRYVQAKRHAWGVTEAAWMFLQAKRVPYSIYSGIAPMVFTKEWTEHCEFAGLLMLVFPGTWSFLFSLSTPALIAVMTLPTIKFLVGWIVHLAVEILMWTTILPNNPEFPRVTRWQWVVLVVHMATWPVMCMVTHIMFETIPRLDAMIHAFFNPYLVYITAPKGSDLKK